MVEPGLQGRAKRARARRWGRLWGVPMGALSLALWTPAIGALLIGMVPRASHRLIRGIALLHAALAMFIAWSLLFDFDPRLGRPQLAERVGWHTETGMSYSLAVDGLSLPLVLLATTISLVALIASDGVREHVKSWHLWFLLLESAMLGVFLARDWTLFYMFWEAALIPLFFLINRWGGPRRGEASLSFVLYTMGGSVFLLLALLVLYRVSPWHSFDMGAMAATGQDLPRGLQIGLFLGFLVGFGVKMPIIGLHGWAPLAYAEAPIPVCVISSAVLLKMGAYGLMRACWTLPHAAEALGALLGGLAVLGILYGGLLAWRQRDLKSMIAWSSISHMGVVLLGIAARNEAGLLGAGHMMVAHGLVAAALFLMVGELVSRTGSQDVGDYGGLMRTTPRLAALMSLALMASLGLPGLAGFAGELHAIVGGMQRWGWPVALASLGVLVSAAYAVRTIGRVFAGPPRPELAGVRDLSGAELAANLPLALGIIGLGVAPSVTLSLMGGTLASLVQLWR